VSGHGKYHPNDSNDLLNRKMMMDQVDGIGVSHRFSGTGYPFTNGKRCCQVAAAIKGPEEGSSRITASALEV
jgi:hypothetical protein